MLFEAELALNDDSRQIQQPAMMRLLQLHDFLLYLSRTIIGRYNAQAVAPAEVLMLALGHPIVQSTATPLFVIVLAFFLLVAIATRSRRYVTHTNVKLCKSCGTSHPNFARFCRSCGRNLDE